MDSIHNSLIQAEIRERERNAESHKTNENKKNGITLQIQSHIQFMYDATTAIDCYTVKQKIKGKKKKFQLSQ